MPRGLRKRATHFDFLSSNFLPPSPPAEKANLFAVAAAALIIAGIGKWASSTIHARGTSAVIPISVPMDPFNPFKAMLNATDLPTSQYDDYSLSNPITAKRDERAPL